MYSRLQALLVAVIVPPLQNVSYGVLVLYKNALYRTAEANIRLQQSD